MPAFTARSVGVASFTGPQLDFANFGYISGGWRTAAHPRFQAELNGDNHADLLGFGNAGVFIRRNRI